MTTEQADSRLRASDSEREEIATIVREAVGEGRLDIAEGDTRLAAVYAAKYRDELAPLVNDLPAGRAAAARAIGRPTDRVADWQGPVGPWGRPHRRGRYAGRYSGGWGGTLAHTGFVVFVAGLLTVLWLVSAVHFFWPAIPLFFLVVGLGRHWRYTSWRHASQR